MEGGNSGGKEHDKDIYEETLKLVFHSFRELFVCYKNKQDKDPNEWVYNGLDAKKHPFLVLLYKYFILFFYSVSLQILLHSCFTVQVILISIQVL